MTRRCFIAVATAACVLGTHRSTEARALVQVDIHGTVAFNGIGASPLGTVSAGQAAQMSFMVDSTNFVDGIPGDVRAYAIDPASYMLSFSGGVSMGMLPGPAYFGVVDGFPVSDGFFVSSSTVSPGGVPLVQAPYQAAFNVGYVGSTLTSLDIIAAAGTYDFTGLTNFGYALWAFSPDNVQMEIDFSHMTITVVPSPATTMLALTPLAFARRRR